MKACGAETPDDLARELGLGSFTSPRRIKRWIDGTNNPDFTLTLKLLALAGLLNETADAANVVAMRAGLGGYDRDALLLGLLEQVVTQQERIEGVLAEHGRLLVRLGNRDVDSPPVQAALPPAKRGRGQS